MLLLARAFAIGLTAAALAPRVAAESKPGLKVTWQNNYLTITGAGLPGNVVINYLEAYCRPGSTTREWAATVIKHKANIVSVSGDGSVIRLRDTLEDGVVVDHTISAGSDEVDFRVEARNPTEVESLAHWAQPCVEVEAFAGVQRNDRRELVPAYIRQCFLFIDGRRVMLPTEPWADRARYIPGQVYVPSGVDRNDVNPRPLSVLVPSNGLCGCLSANGKLILATAWEPYQEIFQGVKGCLHTDFRIGGLKPHATRTIRGKIYVLQDAPGTLLARFERDFPEQAGKSRR